MTGRRNARVHAEGIEVTLGVPRTYWPDSSVLVMQGNSIKRVVRIKVAIKDLMAQPV